MAMTWKTRRDSPAMNRRIVARFNLLRPVGTRVRYYPVWGVDEWQEYATREPAYLLNDTQACVFLDGKSGCVSLWHCEVVEAPTSRRVR